MSNVKRGGNVKDLAKALNVFAVGCVLISLLAGLIFYLLYVKQLSLYSDPILLLFASIPLLGLIFAWGLWCLRSCISIGIQQPLNKLQGLICNLEESKKTDSGEIESLCDAVERWSKGEGICGGGESELIQKLREAEQKIQESDDTIHQMKIASERLLLEIVGRSQRERQVSKGKMYLSDMMDSMPSILIATDDDLKITELNYHAEQYTGASSKEALGRKLHEVMTDFPISPEIIKSAIANKKIEMMDKIEIYKDNQTSFYDVLVYPLTSEEHHGAVLRIDDVTQHVRMEEKMVQAEKMMSVGGLAAGMAHELNNPLGGIMQNAQNVLRRMDPKLKKNQEVAEACGITMDGVTRYFKARNIDQFLESINTSGERASKVIKNMLQFSRSGQIATTKCSLEEIVDRALSLSESDYDLKNNYGLDQVKIVKNYEKDLVSIVCSSSEIEQVLFNIIKNAIQMMHEKSKTQRERYEPILTINVFQKKGQLVIEVIDNGPGMTEEIRHRVFEPFFTTKEVGKGTGLGLSVAYFIVATNHRGKLDVESHVGQGSKFIVCLPLA